MTTAPNDARRPVVLITGCSCGIGLATAVAFAERGWTVVAAQRDPSRSGSLQATLGRAGVTADLIGVDVRSGESVADGVARVLTRHDGIDVVVSNADVGYDGTLEELSVEDFRASLDVNFLGAVRLLKAVMPSIRAAGTGRIIGVSSVSGLIGQPFNDAYCAAKFALEGLFEAFHPVASAAGEVSTRGIDAG